MAKTESKLFSSQKDKENDTVWVNVTGIAMYARLNEPKAPTEAYLEAVRKAGGKPDEVHPKWTLDLLVNEATAAALEDAGFELRGTGLGKKDPRNPTYTAFVAAQGLDKYGYTGTYIMVDKSSMRRKYDQVKKQTVMENGKPVFIPADPVVLEDSQGNPIPVDKLLIGNGSSIRIRGSLSGAKFGDYRVRMSRVVIQDLVEYKKESGDNTFVYDPTKTTATPAASANTNNDVAPFEDEIPDFDENVA